MTALVAGVMLIASRAFVLHNRMDIPSEDETQERMEARIARAIAHRNAELGDWRYIVIHHSATPTGNAAKFDAYHRDKKKWSGGLAYHFVIGNGTDSGDGQIEPGPRWEAQGAGAHCGNNYYNSHGIGICIVGNVEETRPTAQQIRSVTEICRQLCIACKIPPESVIGHCEVPDAHTKCPGKNLNMESFRTELARALANGNGRESASK